MHYQDRNTFLNLVMTSLSMGHFVICVIQISHTQTWPHGLSNMQYDLFMHMTHNFESFFESDCLC